MKNVWLKVILFWGVCYSLAAKDYTGAEIRTNESFLYGRFEVKMKSAASSGMLISFFTFYDNPDFVSNWNEIDIEILGRYNNEVQFNAITPGPNGRDPHEKRHVLNFNPHQDFHVYSFDWTPDYISFSVDYQEVYRQTGEHIKTMNRRQKIMMNIWPSEFWEWTGPRDDSKFPLYALYDFVKYYEYTPAAKEKFTLQWADEFETIDRGRWDFASHTFDGNGCTFDAGNGKTKDGILILSLTKNANLESGESAKADEIELPSTNKPMVKEARWTEKNTLKITFAAPVNRVHARKENFTIEGLVIVKSKFAMDMTNLELVFQTIPDLSKEYQLKFKAEDTSQELKVSPK